MSYAKQDDVKNWPFVRLLHLHRLLRLCRPARENIFPGGSQVRCWLHQFSFTTPYFHEVKLVFANGANDPRIYTRFVYYKRISMANTKLTIYVDTGHLLIVSTIRNFQAHLYRDSSISYAKQRKISVTEFYMTIFDNAFKSIIIRD